MSLSPPPRWPWLPNLLSLSRIPLGAAFWFALGPTARQSFGAIAVMVIAALTDVMDGYLARRQARRVGDVAPEQGGGTGAWLDPICDKLFVASVLVAIVVKRHPPLALVALIVSRELLQLPIGLVYRFVPTLHRWLRYDFRASILGKAATVAQFLAIGALILDLPSIRLFAVMAFILGIAALADYVRRAAVLGRRRAARTKSAPTPEP